MITKEKFDENVMIAQFMNIPIVQDEFHGECWNVGEQTPKVWLKGHENGLFNTAFPLPFYKSWDWLIPVVEKVETIANLVKIDRDTCFIDAQNLNKDEVWMVVGGSKIEVTYKAIIEFIKWYNKENKNANRES